MFIQLFSVLIILQPLIQGVCVTRDITEPATRSIPEGRLSVVIYARQGTIVQGGPFGLSVRRMPTTVFQDLLHRLHADFSVSQLRTEELKLQQPRVLPQSVTATLERRSMYHKLHHQYIIKIVVLVV